LCVSCESRGQRCVWVWVCVWVCVCAHEACVCLRLCVCVCVSVHFSTLVYVYVCVYVCVLCLCFCVHVCVSECVLVSSSCHSPYSDDDVLSSLLSSCLQMPVSSHWTQTQQADVSLSLRGTER